MKKKLILCTIPFAIIIIVIVFMNSIPRHDKEETELFKKYQSDFDLITEYIIDNYDTQTEDSLGIYWDNGVPYLYRNNRIPLSNDLENAFNNIMTAFKHYEFSFVDITPERISYGGLGYRMYVYSRNGKVPDYFYHKGDGISERCYYLGDNWYLLKCALR